MRIFCTLLAALLPCWALAGDDWKITNDRFAVEFDQEDGELEIHDFAELHIDATSVSQTESELRLEGVALAEHVTGTLCVRLEKDSPWVTFLWTLQTDRDGTTFDTLHFPAFVMDDDFLPGQMKALGSSGLTAVDGHDGSYMFLAVADPETRAGVVGGWVTSELGSGILQSDILREDDDETNLEIRAFEEFGILTLFAGKPRTCDVFVLGRFDDCRLGLETYADTVATHYNIVMKPAPSGYCTWYSDRNGGAGNEASTAEFATMAAEKLVPYGMNFFQIDDHWQLGNSKNGPKKNFSAHNPTGPYPAGMRATTDTLNAHGMVSGLWFMPFSGNFDDPYYADKQDWFVKSAIDYPLPGEKNTRRFSGINQKQGAPYETFWGGTALDMTHPDVEKYLDFEVAQIANDWGYKYFKIDGTWVAMAVEQLYVNDGYLPDDIGKQIFHDPNLTNVEVFRKGMERVREIAGNDVFIMNCNVSQNMRSMGASYGISDAMRIGPDNGASWNDLCRGPVRGSARYFYNGRVWWNDPDPVYVRNSIPLEHAQLITSWAAITGQLYAFSDWLPTLSDERVNVLQRTLSNHNRTTVRPVDLFSSELANIWLLTSPATETSPRRDIVALFNWSATEPQEIDCDLAFLGLEPGKKYVAYDFWKKTFIPVLENRLHGTLEPGSCQILSVRAIEEHPVVVSTSRHVASPILEMKEESWDAKENVLSGVSRVVLGDEYEMEIFAPFVDGKAWKPTQVDVENLRHDAAQIERWEATVSYPMIRVRFTMKLPENVAQPEVANTQYVGENPNTERFTRDVRWKITFQPSADNTDQPLSFSPDVQFRAEPQGRNILVTWTQNGQPLDFLASCGYILTRKCGSSSSTLLHPTGNSYLDRNVQGGLTYEYTLQFLRFDGSVSPDALHTTLTTPEAPKLPPLPPEPEVDLSTLKRVSQSTEWGSIQNGKTCAGEPLVLDGVPYSTGLGIHASGHMTFAVPEGSTRFVAVAGLDDSKKTDDRRSVIIRIYTDVKEMGESPVLAAESPLLNNEEFIKWHFDIPIDSRVKELRIEISDAQDGINCDHVDIVRAGFLLTD